jgi:hypothetical protein
LSSLPQALEAALIERTIPNTPNSRLQKHRLTPKAALCLKLSIRHRENILILLSLSDISPLHHAVTAYPGGRYITKKSLQPC